MGLDLITMMDERAHSAGRDLLFFSGLQCVQFFQPGEAEGGGGENKTPPSHRTIFFFFLLTFIG